MNLNYINENFIEKNYIILLAHLMSSEAVLNNESKKRANLAARLFSKLNDSIIITNGWDYRSDCSVTTADAFRLYLLNECSIPEEEIFCQRFSRDTVGDAVFSKLFLSKSNMYKSIWIVTSDYHLERCKVVFQFIFGKFINLRFIGSETSQALPVNDKENDSLSAFKRTFEGIKVGDINSIKERLIERHPFYNGDIYPKFNF